MSLIILCAFVLVCSFPPGSGDMLSGKLDIASSGCQAQQYPINSFKHFFTAECTVFDLKIQAFNVKTGYIFYTSGS
jgi:hypothetical protein